MKLHACTVYTFVGPPEPAIGFCPEGNGYVDSQSLSMRTGRPMHRRPRLYTLQCFTSSHHA